MASWSKTFTQIDNVNGGQEFGVNDYPTTQGFNVPINNTQYLYNLLQAGFIKSYTISNGTVTIVSRGVNGQDTTTTMTIDTLNGYTKQQIDNNFVKYTSQSLTDAQKAQARTNINAPAKEMVVSDSTTTLENTGNSINLLWRSREDSKALDVQVDYNDMYFYQKDEDGEVISDFYLIERLDNINNNIANINSKLNKATNITIDSNGRAHITKLGLYAFVVYYAHSATYISGTISVDAFRTPLYTHVNVNNFYDDTTPHLAMVSLGGFTSDRYIVADSSEITLVSCKLISEY